MTWAHSGETAAASINEVIPGAAVEYNQTDVWVLPEHILDVARHLKSGEGLDFSYLNALSAVDYVEYFEMVYHLLSLRRNSSLVVKSRVAGREDPVVSSVWSVWKGADLQEREVWDLMGIRFDGHPNMKRVMLWEGFPGHPLRKDFL